MMNCWEVSAEVSAEVLTAAGGVRGVFFSFLDEVGRGEEAGEELWRRLRSLLRPRWRR